MRKKIGLLTFHNTTNFGSLLQTFALYKKIKDFGCDIEIIDYHCKAVEMREFIIIPNYHIKNLIKYLFHLPKKNYFKKFIKTQFNLSRPFYSSSEIVADKYNIVISGSDILWGRDITDSDYTYFLDFCDDSQIRYSYASSVGDFKLWDNDLKVKKLLSKFNRITVREKQSLEPIYSITENIPDLVCDPTMLLSKKEWLTHFNPNKKFKNYVLVYFDNADHKCLNDAKSYAKANGKNVIFINYGKPRKGVKNIKPHKIYEFLSLIYFADFIFSSSYHGILFSIYFEKEFAYYNLKHRERMDSLSSIIGFGDRCFDSKSIFDVKKMDYEILNLKIDEFRNCSLKILRELVISDEM